MVEFVVSRERVEDPQRRGRMLKRGYVFQLEPERYSAHAALAERLRRKEGRGWTERRPSASSPASKAESDVNMKTDEQGLLPHQLEAVKAIQKNLQSG